LCRSSRSFDVRPAERVAGGRVGVHQLWEDAIRAACAPDADVAAILHHAQQKAQRVIEGGQ